MRRRGQDGGTAQGGAVHSVPELTPLELIELLYGGMTAQGAVEFRIFKRVGNADKWVVSEDERGWMPWPCFPGHPDEFTLDMIPANRQAYFGLSLRRDSSNGKAENCKPTHLLWADLDLKDAPQYLHGQVNVKELEPEELREGAQALFADLMTRCDALRLPPALILNSGHGLQAVWKGEASIPVDETESRNKALVAELKDLGADSKTVDIARVFRVPGSQNLKNPARPLSVEIWHADADAVVTEEALGKLAQRHAPRSTPAPALKAAPSTAHDGGNVIEEWNRRNPIQDVLERYGYVREDAKTYTRPGDDASGRDVKLLENSKGVMCSYHHSSNDPIDGGNGDGHLREPFDLYAEYEHGGDMKAAVKAAAAELGMSYPSGSSSSGPRKPAPRAELEWGERQPLPPALPEVSTMPPEMVPEPLRGWLVDTAELACVPLEGVAAPAVVGLSGLIGRSVQIQPEVFGGWTVVPNLWGALVLRPSALKSMQLGAGLEPLDVLEAHARAEFEEEELEREIRQEDLKLREEALKKAAKGKGGSLDVEALRELRLEQREAAPTPRRYTVQDTTYQKLGELLRENPQGLTLVRDEMSGWIDNLSQEENSPARSFWLTTWNGDTPYVFETIGRGSTRIDSACMAVIGAIQPGPLNRFVMRSRAGSAGDVGLLQRFQLLVYPDSLGKWTRPRRRMDADAKAQAFKVYEALDTLRRAEEPLTLTFSEEAQPVFEEWRDALENRLRGGELAGSPAYESHLGKYRSLVPSLALIFHLIEEAAHGRIAAPGPVSIDALELALNWEEYLELHAMKVYALDLGLSNGPAHDLAEKIKAGAVKDGDKLRDLRRKDWRDLRDELLGMAVEQLTALGWVQVEEIETGGRPSEVLRLHPDLIAGEA